MVTSYGSIEILSILRYIRAHHVAPELVFQSKICKVYPLIGLLTVWVSMSLNVSAQIVIRERVEVARDSVEIVTSPMESALSSSDVWAFTEAGTLRLALVPAQQSGGTIIEQCYPSRDHKLNVTYYGSRANEIKSINLEPLIVDQYDYWYPECQQYTSYGFAGIYITDPEVYVDLGLVEPGDSVTVDHLFQGVTTGTLPASVTFPDTPEGQGQSGSGGIWTWDIYYLDGPGPSLSLFRAEFVEEPSLTVSLDQDTLLVTEMTQITVDGVSDPDAVITLSTASLHGRLLRVIGSDTTEVAGPLTWSEIGSSEILFVADGEWPESATLVEIVVALADGTSSEATLSLLAPALRLDLSVDPATYLPVKNDTLTATAHLDFVPEGVRSEIDFELVYNHDFTFIDGTSGLRSEPVLGDSSFTRLISKTWWGVATIQASVLAGTPTDTLHIEVQVPVDSDSDTIADIWELDPLNGGSMNLGGLNNDSMWNDEYSVGNANNGDAFNKLEEYRGVLIGSENHVRLIPMRKEIFMDIRLAQEGNFVVGEIESQLDIDVYEIEGVRDTSGASVGVVVAGDNHLVYVSPSTVSLGSKAVVFVADYDLIGLENGFVILDGYWRATGTKTPPENGYDITLGNTRGTAFEEGAISICYVNTIDNIFNSNSVRESEILRFPVRSAEINGDANWTALFNNTDITGDTDTDDLLKPFDIAAPAPPPNSPEDGIVVTMTGQEMIKRTTLHEVGHALGMSLRTEQHEEGEHPTDGASVMRLGIGPAKVGTFSSEDIQQMRLK